MVLQDLLRHDLPNQCRSESLNFWNRSNRFSPPSFEADYTAKWNFTVGEYYGVFLQVIIAEKRARAWKFS
jgi:hypothetical protein